MAKKKNWSILSKQKPTDTVKYRDVYEDQQLERSHISDKQGMTSRIILAAFAGIASFALLYFCGSAIHSVMHRNDIEESQDPSKLYFHVNEHYISQDSDVVPRDITKSEYDQLVKFYNERSANNVSVEPPVEPENPNLDTYEYYSERQGYMVRGYPDTFITEAEYNSRKERYQRALDEYRKRLERYETYEKASRNPAETYVQVFSHYRSIRDPEVILTEEDYNDLNAKYQSKLSKGRISPDNLDVPKRPIDPEDIWSPDKYSDADLDADGDPMPIVYRNNYDGTTISYKKYDELMARFDKEWDIYAEGYTQHKQRYHAGEGSISLKPNSTNVGAGLFVGLLVFSILLAVLKKNLDAQNTMADTTDINQYQNDQHIALPEEIQKNYDWFPDVGAHSAVQVSSMISHMALSNKGLKTVELATRADKDIVDNDGNVEYYKGEILLDKNGNPVVTTQPIIDEAFMEALFDASGAPKETRKKYDATKIPYNPDGSNRDKLGTYACVSDLINDDWEFPIYEPQRPGGAYIVDTAPVNTMV